MGFCKYMCNLRIHQVTSGDLRLKSAGRLGFVWLCKSEVMPAPETCCTEASPVQPHKIHVGVLRNLRSWNEVNEQISKRSLKVVLCQVNLEIAIPESFGCAASFVDTKPRQTNVKRRT